MKRSTLKHQLTSLQLSNQEVFLFNNFNNTQPISTDAVSKYVYINSTSNMLLHFMMQCMGKKLQATSKGGVLELSSCKQPSVPFKGP